MMFCEWLGESPDEILENRKRDLKSDDPRVQRRYESALKRFDAYLRDLGYSVSSRQVAWAAVSSFFEMNYVRLRLRRGDYPSGESVGRRAATREDILRLLNAAGNDKRLRALVLFLKDSGLRVSDVVRLKYGDIRKPFEAGEDFIPIRIVTKKNSILAKTAIGPEAVQALREYLEQRRRGTRRVPPEKITDDSPLFRVRGGDSRAPTRSAVSSMMSYLISKAGLAGEINAHSLRKFTETRLEAAGVSPNWIDQILGHRPPGSRPAYSRPRDEELFEAYKQAYHALRVFEAPASAAEVERLAADLRAARQEIQNLKTELALSLSQRALLVDSVRELQAQVEALREIITERGERRRRWKSRV